MIRKFLKTITGGNNRAEHEYLEKSRTGKITIDYLQEIYRRGVHVDTFHINEKGCSGQTALMTYLSSYDIRTDVVHFMLKEGAKANHVSSHGHTPLSNLSYGKVKEGNKIGIIEALISRNANPNSIDSSGYTPLHNFCSNGTKEEVKKILELGGMNSLNHCGKTNPSNWYWGFAPIHKAIYQIRRCRIETARTPIIELLIDIGADMNLACKSTLRFTPMSLIDHEIREDELSQKNREITVDNDLFITNELLTVRKMLIAHGAKKP